MAVWRQARRGCGRGNASRYRRWQALWVREQLVRRVCARDSVSDGGEKRY